MHVKSVSGGGKATISNGTLTVDTTGATGNKITVDMIKGSHPSDAHPTTVWSNGSYQKLVTGSFTLVLLLR